MRVGQDTLGRVQACPYSTSSLQEIAQRPDGCLDRQQGFRLEGAEALGEPRRPPLAHRAEEPLASGRQLESDAAPVYLLSNADEQAGALEPVDVTRERRRRDPLCRG